MTMKMKPESLPLRFTILSRAYWHTGKYSRINSKNQSFDSFKTLLSVNNNYVSNFRNTIKHLLRRTLVHSVHYSTICESQNRQL